LREVNQNGLCQIEDESPLLSDENQLVHELFDQALQTSNCVEGNDKNYYYIKPADIESLMNIHGIDAENKSETIRRIQTLQDITNRSRPNRPKAKG